MTQHARGRKPAQPGTAIALSGQKPAKPPRISKRVRQALDLLATGECKTKKAAAVRVGLSHEHLIRQMGRDHVRALLRERTTKTLVQALPRAAERVVELMDCDSAKVSLEAASHLLALDGIKPPAAPVHAVGVNVNICPGYIVKVRDRENELGGWGRDAEGVKVVSDGRPIIDGEVVSRDEAAE